MNSDDAEQRDAIEAKYLSTAKRGGLTKEDREYLHGKDLTDGSEYNARRRIRERIHDTLLDFSVLIDRFDENEELIREGFEEDDLDIEEEPASVIALLFCAITDRPDWAEGNVRPTALLRGRGGHHSISFLRVLEAALNRAYMENDIVFEGGELEIKTTRVPQLKTIRRNLEEGETLHPKLGALLLESGQIDEDAFTEFAREQLLDEQRSDE